MAIKFEITASENQEQDLYRALDFAAFGDEVHLPEGFVIHNEMQPITLKAGVKLVGKNPETG